MEENKLPDYFGNMLNQIEEAQKGKFICITVIGEIKKELISMAEPKKISEPIAVARKSNIILYEKPRRKIIKTNSIESIEEHEKGSKIIFEFTQNDLIVEESLELLLVNAGIKFEG